MRSWSFAKPWALLLRDLWDLLNMWVWVCARVRQRWTVVDLLSLSGPRNYAGADIRPLRQLNAGRAAGKVATELCRRFGVQGCRKICAVCWLVIVADGKKVTLSPVLDGNPWVYTLDSAVFQGRYQQCGNRSEGRGLGIAVLTCHRGEKERLSPPTSSVDLGVTSSGRFFFLRRCICGMRRRGCGPRTNRGNSRPSTRCSNSGSRHQTVTVSMLCRWVSRKS